MARRTAPLAALALLLVTAPAYLNPTPGEYVMTADPASGDPDPRNYADVYDYGDLPPEAQAAVNRTVDDGRYVLDRRSDPPPEFAFPGDAAYVYLVHVGDRAYEIRTANHTPFLPVGAAALAGIVALGATVLVSLPLEGRGREGPFAALGVVAVAALAVNGDWSGAVAVVTLGGVLAFVALTARRALDR